MRIGDAGGRGLVRKSIDDHPISLLLERGHRYEKDRRGQMHPPRWLAEVEKWGGLAVYKREVDEPSWKISFLFPFHPFAISKTSFYSYKHIVLQT